MRLILFIIGCFYAALFYAVDATAVEDNKTPKVTYHIQQDGTKEARKFMEQFNNLRKMMLEGTYYGEWNRPSDFPENAKETFKKPSLDVKIEETSDNEGYIKCITRQKL